MSLYVVEYTAWAYVIAESEQDACRKGTDAFMEFSEYDGIAREVSAGEKFLEGDWDADCLPYGDNPDDKTLGDLLGLNDPPPDPAELARIAEAARCQTALPIEVTK